MTSARDRLQLTLRRAIKERDSAAISALRSALAELGNAEAVSVPAGPAPAGSPGSQYVAGAAGGVGETEAERRVLAEAEAEAIIRREAVGRLTVADDYEQAGYPERAERLRREAAILTAAIQLDSTGPSRESFDFRG